MTERSGYAETVTIEQLFAENQQLKKRIAELERCQHEYICKCGVRVEPHKCRKGGGF